MPCAYKTNQTPLRFVICSFSLFDCFSLFWTPHHADVYTSQKQLHNYFKLFIQKYMYISVHTILIFTFLYGLSRFPVMELSHMSFQTINTFYVKDFHVSPSHVHKLSVVPFFLALHSKFFVQFTQKRCSCDLYCLPYYTCFHLRHNGNMVFR